MKKIDPLYKKNLNPPVKKLDNMPKKPTKAMRKGAHKKKGS